MAHRMLSSSKERMWIKHLTVPAPSRSLYTCQPLFFLTTPFKILWQFWAFKIVIYCQFLSFVIYWPYFLESLLFLVYYCFSHRLESQNITFGQLSYFLGTRFLFFFFFLSLHSIIFCLQTKITFLLRSDHRLALASLPLDDAGCPWLRLSPSADFSKIQIFFFFFFFCLTLSPEWLISSSFSP